MNIAAKPRKKDKKIAAKRKTAKGKHFAEPLRIARASGNPLDPNHVIFYQQDYERTFNAIQKKLGIDDSTALTEEQADRFNALLGRCERIIRARYPTIGLVKWQAYTQLKRKMKYYGAPILVSIEASSGKLCYIVMDEAEGRV